MAHVAGVPVEELAPAAAGAGSAVPLDPVRHVVPVGRPIDLRA